MLLDAKLHPSDSAPSNPGIGTIWYDTQNDLVKIYDNTATGNVGGWNTISGDITGVGSATTNQLTVANSSGPVPSFSIVTGAVANAGTALATGDQIHTFVTTQTDSIAADTSGNAATATLASTVTVTDSDTNTFFPIVFHNESNGLLDDTGIFEYNPNTGNLNLPKANFDGVFLVGTVSADPIIRSTSNDQTIYIQTQTGGSTVTNLAISPTAISGTAIKDEDNMSSNSANHLATQQSIKAYVDGKTYDDVSIANLKTKLAGGFGSNAVTIGDSDDVVTIGNDLIITGDLTVSGDTISANVATLNVEDKNITLNYSSGDSSSTAGGSGITIQDAVNSSTDATILWDASNDEFDFSHAINITGTITASGNITGNLVGNVTGDLTGDVTGNVSGTASNVTGTVAIANGGTGQTTASAAFNALKQAATTSATGVVELATATEAKNGSGSGKVVDASQIGARSVVATIDVSDSTFTSNRYAEITHNLGTTDIIVQLYDTSTEEIVYADVARTDKNDSTSANKVKISFAQVPTNDIRVVIVSNKGASSGTVAYS